MGRLCNTNGVWKCAGTQGVIQSSSQVYLVGLAGLLLHPLAQYSLLLHSTCLRTLRFVPGHCPHQWGQYYHQFYHSMGCYMKNSRPHSR